MTAKSSLWLFATVEVDDVKYIALRTENSKGEHDKHFEMQGEHNNFHVGEPWLHVPTAKLNSRGLYDVIKVSWPSLLADVTTECLEYRNKELGIIDTQAIPMNIVTQAIDLGQRDSLPDLKYLPNFKSLSYRQPVQWVKIDDVKLVPYETLGEGVREFLLDEGEPAYIVEFREGKFPIEGFVAEKFKNFFPDIFKPKTAVTPLAALTKTLEGFGGVNPAAPTSNPT